MKNRIEIDSESAEYVRLMFLLAANGNNLSKIAIILNAQGIPTPSLEYTAAIHRDKGHPHCHILFWDKAQDIKKEAYVYPKVSNAVRIGLIKHVFGEEMAELQTMKNEARKAALDNADGFFGGFVDAFADMTSAEYASAVERLKREGDLADGKLIYSRFNPTDMKELATDLFNLAFSIWVTRVIRIWKVNIVYFTTFQVHYYFSSLSID